MKKLVESEFNKSSLDGLIKNARKYNEEDFAEEYVYQNRISIFFKDNNFDKSFKKGEKVILTRYISSNVEASFYKQVICDKDYSSTSHWQLILDNTKELQEEAKKIYHENKNKWKPKKNFKNYIIAYHASPNYFKNFEYQDYVTTGKKYSNIEGFFFFTDEKVAKSVGEKLGYLYVCKIKSENMIVLNGAEIGTGNGRLATLATLDDDVTDCVLIKGADTGYAITDEVVVFDDDNIIINDILKFHI